MQRTKQITSKTLVRTKKPHHLQKNTKAYTNRPRNADPNKKYTLKELEDILSDRHKDFVHQYLITGYNGSKSYGAVYKTTNVNTNKSNAVKLLSDTYIQQYLAFKKLSFEDIVGISKHGQLMEYKKIAQASIRDLRNGWMDMRDWEVIVKNNPDILDAVSVVDTKEERFLDQFKRPVVVTYIKIKMHDKIKALERIDKLMGYDEPERINVVIEQPLFPEL